MAQSNFQDFEFQEDRQGQIQYPRKAMIRRSAASSVNSADVRNGRHGVMAKCKQADRIAASDLC